MIFSKKKYLFLGIFIFVFLAFPPAYYFYSQYQKMSDDYEKTKSLLNKSSKVLAETSNQEIVDRVSKLIELPSETPTIEKITDKSIFGNQAFFNSSQIGDTIIVFNNAKKIIIYREGVNKIVDVGTLVGSSELPIATQGASEY